MVRYFPPLKTNCSRCKDKLPPLHSLFPVLQWVSGLSCMQAGPISPRFSKVGWLEPVSHYFLISLLHSLPVRTRPTGSLPPIQ